MKALLGYLSFDGRFNRARYWFTVLWIFGSFLVCALLTGAVVAVLPILAIVLIPVFCVLIYASFANGARRLHDRGKSAWWLLLFTGLPMLLSLPGQIAEHSPDDGARMAGAMFALLGLPFSIWGFIEIGCLKGKAGPNRFGEDPLPPAETEAFA